MGRGQPASKSGIEAIRKAMKREGWTQQELADELRINRSTVSNFCRGLPIDRTNFAELCRILGLELEDIAAKEAPEADDRAIDELVQYVRREIEPTLKERYGSMRVLDMQQPIELTGDQGIYTKVNILEKITGRQRRNLQEMLEQVDLDEFDRFGLGRVVEKPIPGLEAVKRYKKLMVLGKPGAGKTTFLKWLTMQCISGNEWADRVPMFVTLKQFAEAEDKPSLIAFIQKNLGSAPKGTAEKLLQAGRGLVLLDGLDEVREEDTERILREIESLSNQYLDNQYILTCRVAAKEYTFELFTEVEVSDFDDEQIQTFISNWFRAKEEPDCADLMWKKLTKNPPIKELASSPLLLTLLCLMFEDATDFPANRSELYQEGVDVLLKKWDGKRKIQRDEVYKKLSLKRKEDLLSQIALMTFENKDYFFKQRRVEELIEAYIINLPDAKDDPEVLRLDREAVLKSIESQHGLLVERAKGIYSFSHLTFQEFFGARQIVETRNFELLQSRCLEKRWREVILLSLEMLHNADDLLLLLKAGVDALVSLVSYDEKIQAFLAWVQHKTDQVKSPYKATAVRAFYYSVALYLDRALYRALYRDRARDLALDRARDLNLTDLENYLTGQQQALHNAINLGGEGFAKWWKADGEIWMQDLRQTIINHRNIGHDWQFSQEQIQLLKQYYEGNRLLATCLNSGCYLSKSVRQKIEDEMLLPMAEIERRNSKI